MFFFSKTRTRGEPLEGEIFEILAGLTDFFSFKEMMIHHQSVRVIVQNEHIKVVYLTEYLLEFRPKKDLPMISG